MQIIIISLHIIYKNQRWAKLMIKLNNLKLSYYGNLKKNSWEFKVS